MSICSTNKLINTKQNQKKQIDIYIVLQNKKRQEYKIIPFSIFCVIYTFSTNTQEVRNSHATNQKGCYYNEYLMNRNVVTEPS